MSLEKILGWNVINDDVALEPRALTDAWNSAESILLAPRRRGVGAPWFERAISCVPAEFRHGHIALLTSGSTGEPKLVVGSRSRAERMVKVIHDAQRNDQVDRTVVLLPLTYSYAFVNQWLWAHCHSRRIEVTRGATDFLSVFELLKDGPPSMVCLVYPLFSILAQALPRGLELESVVRLNFAGGPFPYSQLDAVRKVFPNAEIFNNYGCTEALPRLTVTPATELVGANDIGVPLPGVSMRVGRHGELEFSSEFAAVGVVASSGWQFIGDGAWLGTQDIAEVVNGRFHLLGRASEVYKRYGEKVSTPQQLNIVRQIWAGSATTFPTTDASGEAAHVLVLSPEPSDEQLRAVLKVFRTSFPRAHWPLRIESSSAIPVTPNGKVDLAVLTARDRKVHWRQRV